MISFAAALLLASVPASAATWEFEDTYIGGTAVQYVQNGGDVISLEDEIDVYDITGMTVTIDDDMNVTVTIHTNYTPELANDTTDYGDLFISIDGTDTTGEDETYYSTGTTWEYVFDTSSERLYSFDSDGAVLSSDVGDESGWVPEYYRQDQLVLYEAGEDEESLASGSFDDAMDGILVYTFNLADLGLSDEESYTIVLRWAMTCANDVIEVELNLTPVPEAPTLAMMGLGLICLLAGARRFRPGMS